MNQEFFEDIIKGTVIAHRFINLHIISTNSNKKG